MSLLLGVPDRLVKENETTTWDTNKIGGSPDWFRENTPLPCCTKCQRELMLVMQVHCPLTDSSYHRCLHVFVCPAKHCSSQNYGWRVMRTQLLDETTAAQQSDSTKSAEDVWATNQDDWDVGQDDWGVGQNDWGDGFDDVCIEGSYGGKRGILPGETTKGHLSTTCPEESTADRLSGMTISNDPHQTFTSTSPLSQTQSPDKQFLGQNGASDFDSCDNGERCLEHTSVSDSKDSSSNKSGVEPLEQVQVEAVALDDDSMQRMMGLLAAQQDSENEDRHKKATETTQREIFPAYYLQVFAESDMEEDMSGHVASLLQEYEQREGQQFSALLSSYRKGQSGSDGEKYDKTEVKHGDKQCYKFIKRLQICPQQCIRYQWKGSPLLMTRPRAPLTAGRCEKCREPRLFELQLVPPLIALLKLPEHSEPLVEFGTVLVYTCSGSCWSDREVCREEVVILQHDPDQHRFK